MSMYRTAIVKGYTLRVLYTDTSSSSHYFEEDNLEGLRTMVSDLFENMLDAVVRFTVEKDYSKPGETITLKVRHQ